MMLRYAITIIAAFLALGAPASAKPVDELIEIAGGKPITLRPDRAYLMFRVTQQSGVTPLEPLLMRVPTAEEIARYEAAKAEAFAKALPGLTKTYQRNLDRLRQSAGSADPAPTAPTLESFPFAWDAVGNLQDVDFGRQFVKTAAEETFLVEALPGDYVLYGFTPSTGLPRLMVCLCLGSVGFSAKAGEVTDLGYLISDFAYRPSKAPELKGQGGYTGTVRAARADSSMPPALADARITPATYRAVGRFFTPNAVNIGRLAEVPGVLDYAGGTVIDAATGQAVPDNF
ncbi:hypothetical protein [Porphyrobacter sp. ULC335]|uniref:hypothetical protein n=1 Tax=Porphyrobacter sp. ULC335 TaxID=2854260 RepID=UPI00222019B3|nr:hypothetical protein [Porphyrobacter sp. ULC335]UYV15570.1 hypothetical protein KVF90_15965 [Porphyrobacter sp. ULC335]